MDLSNELSDLLCVSVLNIKNIINPNYMQNQTDGDAGMHR